MKEIARIERGNVTIIITENAPIIITENAPKDIVVMINNSILKARK